MSSIQTKIWFYYSNGKDHGPFDPEGIIERARSGEITPSTLVRRQGRDYCEAHSFGFIATAFEDANSAKPRRDQFGAVVRKEKPLSIKVPPPFPVPPPLPESSTSSKGAVSPVQPSKALAVHKPEKPESGSREIRYVVAIVACGLELLAYTTIGALLELEWKQVNSFIPRIILVLVMIATWNAITKNGERKVDDIR